MQCSTEGRESSFGSNYREVREIRIKIHYTDLWQVLQVIYSNLQVHYFLVPCQEFELDVLEEAYTTEHWLVRIYKVKDLENRGS